MTTARRDDEMLPRDARVADAWRAASAEEPPPALDAAILAAARRAIGAGPRRGAVPEARRAGRRWWPLAAAATVGAIAAGLLQLAPPERLGAPFVENAVVTDMPAPTAPTVVQKEIGPVSRDVATLPKPFPAAAPKRDEPLPAAASVATAPVPPAPSVPDRAARDALNTESARPPALAKMAAAPATGESPAGARATDRGPLPNGEWIALIRRLRADGRIDDATRELAAFRAAHADHEQLLPADLRDWRPPEK